MYRVVGVVILIYFCKIAICKINRISIVLDPPRIIFYILILGKGWSTQNQYPSYCYL